MKLVYVISHNSYGLRCVHDNKNDVADWIRKNVENYTELKMFADDTSIAEVIVGDENHDNWEYYTAKSFMENL